MSPGSTVRQLEHPALRELSGPRLAEARLTDREKLALVLQGAGLGAHLEMSGWHPTLDWEACRCVAGELRTLAAPGRWQVLPQVAIGRLLDTLFGTSIAGRGEARRAARAVQRLWKQRLSPIPFDEIVRDLLEEAPFLWQPSFATSRAHLAGVRRTEDGSSLWVAGPGAFRQRILSLSSGLQSAVELLAGSWAHDCWDAALGVARGGDPVERALGWRRVGRLLRAIEELAGVADVPSRCLLARCHFESGDPVAATAVLQGLSEEGQGARDAIELLALKVAVLSSCGSLGGVASVGRQLRALGEAGGPLTADTSEYRLALAEVWVALEEAAAARPLAAGLEDHGCDGRWAHRERVAAVRASIAEADGDLSQVEQAWARVLGGRRAQLSRASAGNAWFEIGLVRLRLGRLADAERALRHAVRRLRGCDGRRRDLQALGFWLETRIRRGRVAGIEESLDLWSQFALTQAPLTLMVDPDALGARLALSRGQAHGALDLCDRGRERVGERVRGKRPEQVAVLDVLAARALGWLGRGDEAFGRLAVAGEAALAALEPEERIAVLAHAGRRDGAYSACGDSVVGALWADVLAGRPVPAERWSDLRRLDRYRAGRTIHDLGLIDSSVVPVYWKRRAASDLRRFGAGLLAERIEGLEASAWSALEVFVLGGSVESAAVGSLLGRAGYGEARVEIGDDPPRVVNAGIGGGEELSAETPAGRLVLRAPLLDAPLRGLFAVIVGGFRGGKGDDSPSGLPRPIEGRSVFRGVVGESESLQSALTKAAALAAGEMPVLVHGETGSGKELVARGIHERSRRASSPFLAINCAALSDSLLLSDLFGHVRGAFTGADRDRSGVFEAGRGGTVFLDEIGDLPLVAQGMLLRVLQEKEVRRVGESLPRRVDVRVVAATHRDLSQMVATGSFRQDLFFRLAVAVVELPPLRDRGDDVLLLAQDFLARHASDRRLSTRARAQLLGHRWPGNVRELENVLAVAAALSDGLIEPQHLEIPEASCSGGVRGDYHQQVDSFRRRLVEEALLAADGNRAEAARRLGLSRQALSYLSQRMELGRRR